MTFQDIMKGTLVRVAILEEGIQMLDDEQIKELRQQVEEAKHEAKVKAEEAKLRKEFGKKKS